MNRIQILTNQVSLGEQQPLVITERQGRVAIVSMNRPKALNALNSSLMAAIASEISLLDQDESIGCIVLKGNGRAFAAGADIKEMKQQSVASMVTQDFIAPLDAVAACGTPIIAAVHGFAFGGGCELAMACDIILCTSSTKFGQPEVKIGAIPGAGGSQRLLRAVGKSKAMELILTGRSIDGEEARRIGLVSEVFGSEQECLENALEMAREISGLSRPLVRLAKKCVEAADELPLHQGIDYERRVFHSVFGLEDQTEGMEAFAAKRKPHFKHC